MIHTDKVILVSYTVFHDNENIQQKQDFEKIDQLFTIIFFFIIETEKEILKLPAWDLLKNAAELKSGGGEATRRSTLLKNGLPVWICQTLSL